MIFCTFSAPACLLGVEKPRMVRKVLMADSAGTNKVLLWFFCCSRLCNSIQIQAVKNLLQESADVLFSRCLLVLNVGCLNKFLIVLVDW